MTGTMVLEVTSVRGNALRSETDYLGVDSVGERTCSVDGCLNDFLAKGLCRKHYQRVWKYNDPLLVKKAHRLHPDEAAAVMRAAGLEPLVPYPGANPPWLCRCTTCGSEGSPSYSYVASHGKGCAPCGHASRAAAWRAGGHPNLIGDDAGYKAVHLRLKRMRGKASAHVCVDCGGQAADWSYTGDSDTGLVSTEKGVEGLLYSTDLDAYVPRCKRCHKRHDNEVRNA